MREALERGIQRGELEADMNVELALDLLSGSMLWRSLMSGESINEGYTREVVQRVLRAFEPSVSGTRRTSGGSKRGRANA
jgi:hypothetical protein